MDDYDLLALFTAACLASGKGAEDAVREAERAVVLVQQELQFEDD